MSLKQVKNKITSVEKIHKVTKAMEAVSAVKMRKSQAQAFQGRPYALSALSILKRLSGSMDIIDHPFAVAREVKKICVVVVSSDKGLAGSLNSSLFKKAEEVTEGYQKEDVVFITLGKKAYEFFGKRGFPIYAHHENIHDTVTEADISEMTEKITSGYSREDFDRVILVYPNFVSTFEQKSVARVMLPIARQNVKEIVDGIVPAKGMYSDMKDAESAEEKPAAPYTVEPNDEAVLSTLLPILLGVELYHGVLEAKASEHSARMVAMKNASDKANDLSKEFRLEFNKERQAQITSEMSEIIGGIETTS